MRRQIAGIYEAGVDCLSEGGGGAVGGVEGGRMRGREDAVCGAQYKAPVPPLPRSVPHMA
eukprot:1328099-Rhodomonas_salina.2